MAKNVGQAVLLSTTVTDVTGALADASVVLAVTDPSGVITTPAVVHGMG